MISLYRLSIVGMLLLAGFYWARPLVGATVVLAFVPPAGPAATSSWGAPVDLARLLLESPGLTDGVCHYFEGRPDPDKQNGLRGAFALLDEQKLVVTPLGDSVLEFEVLDPDPKMARLYCQAVLAYLREAIQEERRSKEVNSQLASDLLQAEDRVVAQESRLAKNLANPNLKLAGRTTDLITHFAVNHYREALATKDQAQQRQLRWTADIESNAPHFLVLAGPTAFRRYPRSAMFGLVVAAILTVGGLFLPGRK